MTRWFAPTEAELIRMARHLAQRERTAYDQITLPLVLEALADALERRITAERNHIAVRLDAAASMRRGEG